MAQCNSIDSTKCNSVETSNLNNQQFRLNKINEIKNYFVAEIKERELVSERLRKYIATLDYFDKSLIVLSATSGSISIPSFATVIGTPVTIASAGLKSLSAGLAKKILKTTIDKKKKHNNIFMLARGKVEALMNNEISHEDFITILNEERSYRELKESIRIMKGQEKTRY